MVREFLLHIRLFSAYFNSRHCDVQRFVAVPGVNGLRSANVLQELIFSLERIHAVGYSIGSDPAIA